MSDESLPEVHLEVSGDVFRAGGSTADAIAWDIYAEAESFKRARCRVLVHGVQVADITVHAHNVIADGCSDLAEEVQQVCAALVWSAIRSVRIRRGKP